MSYRFWQITTETDAAGKVANKATEEIANLQGRLDELKKMFLSNELDVKKSAAEAATAGRESAEAENASDILHNWVANFENYVRLLQAARELERKFEEASRKLDDKSKASGEVKERAENLRERAEKLAENATGKLKNLQGRTFCFQSTFYLIARLKCLLFLSYVMVTKWFLKLLSKSRIFQPFSFKFEMNHQNFTWRNLKCFFSQKWKTLSMTTKTDFRITKNESTSLIAKC